ncbi:membrane protein insertase YidC, partial [Vibrio fluvialis]|uniref:membrane protein insertase YidC n=1 Tax=Vibrio fluvialis TaxID=676 RepID=UPI001EEB64DE
MDSQRNILLIALALVSFLLFQQWQVAKNPAPQAVEQAQTSSAVPAPSLADEFDPVPSQSSAAAKVITVTTDVLTLSIDTVGGDVVTAKLNQYSEELDSENPFVLLKNTQGHQFIAQSGLIGPQGIDLSSSDRPTYTVDADSFTLADGQDELRIPMTYQANGIEYTKTFVLKRGDYAVDVVFDVANNSGSEATLGMYAHLRQNLLDSGGNLAMPTYRGGAYSTSDVRYKKYSFDDMKDRNLSAPNDVTVNWVAMIQHYFASAWIPRDEPQAQLYS